MTRQRLRCTAPATVSQITRKLLRGFNPPTNLLDKEASRKRNHTSILDFVLTDQHGKKGNGTGVQQTHPAEEVSLDRLRYVIHLLLRPVPTQDATIRAARAWISKATP